jgi:hypothetical protein
MKGPSLMGALLALCACGGDLTSPFSAVAITYDVPNQKFKLAQVRLNTLTSLRHLRGSAGVVRAGGKVRVSSPAALVSGATVDSLRASFIKGQPAEVEISWSVLGDIVYPDDFASLELLSTYYNMEKARAELASLGLTSLPVRTIIAHADLANENGVSPLPDGELYYAPMATFFAPATTPQQAVPPAFNLGAVVHALGHQAVEELVWGGAPLPAPEGGTDSRAKHIARSLAEGVGDYLGVAISDDPHWFDHSLQLEPAERALDQIHCSSPDMLDALPVDDSVAPYDPYPLGSVIASALWEEASATTTQNTSRGVLTALTDLGTRAASGLTLPVILDTLAAHAPDDQRAGLCGIFLNRFQQMGIKPTDLPSCGKAPLLTECQ